MRFKIALLAAVCSAGLASPALADAGDPVEIFDGVIFDPIIAARLRYEIVDQGTPAAVANAVTMRLRVGGAVKASGFSVLVEGETNFAADHRYNDTLPGNGVEPFSVVADPENFELNRAQIAFIKNGTGVTVGRQRIIHDNARFVGNVGWRQSEQTFDAVRGQAKIGPVSLNATYAGSQRTIFGIDSPNKHFDGDMILLNGKLDLDVIDVSAFGYLVDYDTRLAFSSATYGVLAKASLPAGAVKINVLASIATQSDYKSNPTDYQATYLNAELGLGVSGFTLTGGYEEMGSDDGVAAFQTPLATLHAFNGWADMFLTTPAAGLKDKYVKLAKGFTIPGLTSFKAQVVYHDFDSDIGGISYGKEWDASLGFKAGPVGMTVKYANYSADAYKVDTEKFWIQGQLSF